MHLRWSAAALVLLAGACGGREDGTKSPPAPPSPPPDEALAAARAADEAGRDAEVPPLLEAAARGEGDTARVATTWLVTTAIQAHDPAAAVPRLERIAREFDGRGKDRGGREFALATLAAAVADEAARAARTRVEGPAPDAAAARAALAAGRKALAMAGDDPDERDLLERAAAYVALSDAPLDIAALAPGASPVALPRVVVVADAFQMGEPVLPSVMRRWARGLPVALVGLETGHVRTGIRRAAATPAEERAAFAEAAAAAGATLVGTTEAKGAAGRRLGLDPSVATVFVLGPEGRIVARASGFSLDATVLDPVVTRLAPAAAPEDAPR